MTDQAMAYAVLLPADDTYSVRISNRRGETGSVRVAVELAPAATTASTAVGGPPVTVTTTQDFQQAQLTFAATAGDAVVITTTGLTQPNELQVVDPDGVPTEGGLIPAPGAVLRQTLTQTGTYTLVFDSNGPPGSVTVRLTPLPADVTATMTVGGPATTVALTELGQRGLVTFTGTESEHVYLTFSANTFPNDALRYVLYAPGNIPYQTGALSSPTGVHVETLPLDGTYTMELQSFAAATGSFTVSIADVPPEVTLATTVNAPAVTIATVRGQWAQVSFPGQSGQHVTLTFEAATYPGNVDFAVQAPDGEFVADGSFTAASYESGVDLAESGDYTVFIEPDDIAGHPELAITDASLAAPGGPTADAVARTRSTAWAENQQDECTPAAEDAPSEDGQEAADPVDLGSGLFLEKHSDLALPDVMPIALTRTYRQRDDILRSFGVATNFSYEGTFLQWVHPSLAGNLKDQIWLVQPDSTKVLFNVVTTPTNTYRFEATGTTGPFRGAAITGTDGEWTLTRADGMTYRFSGNNNFDRMELLQSVADRHGNQVTLIRQNGRAGHIRQILSPNGRWITLTWEEVNSGRITSAQDSTGRSVQYQYDAVGRLTDVTRLGGTTTHYTYDASHRITSIVDGRGITYLTNTYDTASRVASQTIAGTGTYTFQYQGSGAAITQATVTDPAGTVTRTTFDSRHRVLTQTSAVGTPDERTVSTTRDPDTFRPTQVSDPHAGVTAFTYDAGGLITGMTTRAGTAQAETTTFDETGPYGQLRSSTDALGHTISFAYTAAGDVESTSDLPGRTSRYTYNGQGQVLTITDPAGAVTTMSYDRGDLVAVTGPSGSTSRRGIGPSGLPFATVDGLGSLAEVRYDTNFNVTRTVDVLGHETSYTRDANGNLLSVTDARGHTTTVTYDTADRPTVLTDPLGHTKTWSYDTAGQISSSTDQRGVTTVAQHDRLGRLIFSGFGAGSGPTYESTVAYTYDNRDRLATVTDSTGGVTSFGYDNQDRVTSVATPTGTIGYTYDTHGRRASMTVPGQAPVTYDYDPTTGALASMARGSTVVNWQRDPLGRVTSIHQPGLTRALAYDTSSRVTSLTFTGAGGASLGNITYGYDPVGRLSDLDGTLANISIPSTGPPSAYDAGDRLVSRGDHTLTYDNAGNLTTDGTRTYQWNARNELTRVTGAGLDVAYAYDAGGRRQSRTSGGTTVSYLYDGGSLVQEQSGGSPISNRLVAGLDRTIEITDGSGTHAPITDHRGSTLGLVDATGMVTTTYTYDPYGRSIVAGAPTGNTQRYVGREFDAETGLADHRRRPYSPELGRFISQDPLGAGGGSTNLYQYALGDPTNLADPNGDCPVCAVLVTGCVIGGLFNWAVGAGISDYLDRKYTWGDALEDFAMGCALGAFTEGAGAAIRAAYGAAGALEGATAIGATGTRAAAGATKPAAQPLPKLPPTQLGEWGQARMEQLLGYAGFKPTSKYPTSLGGRIPDYLIGRHAFESKAGNLQYGTDILTQIWKDAELLANGTFDDYTWYIFGNADQRILDELTENGIKYILEPFVIG